MLIPNFDFKSLCLMEDGYSHLCKLPQTSNKQGNMYWICDEDFLFYVSFLSQQKQLGIRDDHAIRVCTYA
jgi:hypothetical protein